MGWAKSRFPWKTNPAKGAQKKANITHRAIMRAAITPFMDLPRTRTVISLTVNLLAGIKKVLPLIGDSFNVSEINESPNPGFRIII
jgi:hypothetical protein